MNAILHGVPHVDHIVERIDESTTGQQTVYKLVLRDESGRKVSVLAGEPFEGLTVGDVVRAHFDKVAGGE